MNVRVCRLEIDAKLTFLNFVFKNNHFEFLNKANITKNCTYVHTLLPLTFFGIFVADFFAPI
jgi:hypothetical protein